MADREKPEVVLARIEALTADLSTTSPSGAQTIHTKLTAEFANMRAALGDAAAVEAKKAEAARQAEIDKQKAEAEKEAKAEADRKAAAQTG